MDISIKGINRILSIFGFRIVNRYMIRVHYKSGNKIDAPFYKFKWSNDAHGKSYSWTTAKAGLRPLNLGVDEVESVWIVGFKRVLVTNSSYNDIMAAEND